jgi:hypothetical protein
MAKRNSRAKLEFWNFSETQGEKVKYTCWNLVFYLQSWAKTEFVCSSGGFLKGGRISRGFRIVFVLKIWWTKSTVPCTMWGVVHGGPTTMAGTDLHRISAIGCSGRWGLTMIEGKGRGRRRGSVLLLSGDRKAMRRLLNIEVWIRWLKFVGVAKEVRRRQVGGQNGCRVELQRDWRSYIARWWPDERAAGGIVSVTECVVIALIHWFWEGKWRGILRLSEGKRRGRRGDSISCCCGDWGAWLSGQRRWRYSFCSTPATVHFCWLEEEEGNTGLAGPKGQWAKNNSCENEEKESGLGTFWGETRRSTGKE